MSANPHAATIVLKCERVVETLTRLRHFLPPATLGMLAEAHAFSHVRYAASIWARRITNQDTWNALNSAVAKVAKAVLSLPSTTSNETAVRLIGHRSAEFESQACARRYFAKRSKGDVDDPSVLTGIDLSNSHFKLPPDGISKRRLDLSSAADENDAKIRELIDYNESVSQHLANASVLWSTDGSSQGTGREAGYSVLRWNAIPTDIDDQPADVIIAPCALGSAPYRTELRAIARVTREALALSETQEIRVAGCVTDSMSSIQSIRALDTSEEVTRGILRNLALLGERGVAFHLCFVFSHTGYQVNEFADAYAGLASCDFLDRRRLRGAMAKVRATLGSNPAALATDIEALPQTEDPTLHWYDEWRLEETPLEKSEDLRFAPDTAAQQQHTLQPTSPAPTGTVVRNLRGARPVYKWAREARRWANAREHHLYRIICQVRAGVLTGLGPTGFAHHATRNVATGEPSLADCALCKEKDVHGRGNRSVDHVIRCTDTLAVRLREQSRNIPLSGGFYPELAWESKERSFDDVVALAKYYDEYMVLYKTSTVGPLADDAAPTSFRDGSASLARGDS